MIILRFNLSFAYDSPRNIASIKRAPRCTARAISAARWCGNCSVKSIKAYKRSIKNAVSPASANWPENSKTVFRLQEEMNQAQLLKRVFKPAWQRQNIPHRNSQSWCYQRPAAMPHNSQTVAKDVLLFHSQQPHPGDWNEDVFQFNWHWHQTFWNKKLELHLKVFVMSQPLKDSWARTSSIHGCSHRLPSHHPHFDRTGGIEPCRKDVDQAYGHLGRGTILLQVSLGFKKGAKNSTTTSGSRLNQTEICCFFVILWFLATWAPSVLMQPCLRSNRTVLKASAVVSWELGQV